MKILSKSANYIQMVIMNEVSLNDKNDNTFIHSQGNLHGLHLGTADLNNRQIE